MRKENAAGFALPDGDLGAQLQDFCSRGDLQGYFGALARARPPELRADRSPKPVDRSWPAPAHMAREPRVRLFARHPRLDFAFAHVDPRVVGRASRSVRRGRQGRLHSLKMHRTLRSRSDLELDHLIQCELDGDITAFIEEPVTVEYILDGRRARYRPDALVIGRAQEIIEVKYEADASEPENENRWPQIARAVNAFGYDFRVLTERHLRASTRFATVTTIFENRHATMPPDETLAAVRSASAGEPRPTTRQLIDAFQPHLSLPALCAMIRWGFVAVDLEQVFGMDMVVRPGPGPFAKLGLVAGEV